MGGVFTLAGMGLQMNELALSVGADDTPTIDVGSFQVQLDLWPMWLEIGCRATAEALKASEELSPDLGDQDKGTLLTAELYGGLVAMTAFAFTFDGFYDTVRNQLGAHPHQAIWKEKKKSREAQVTETQRHHLKLGTNYSRQLRQLLGDLFRFRARAVHPDGKWVEPNYRPEIDSHVHPHLITFSGPHARQVRAVILVVLDQLLARVVDLNLAEGDSGWLDRGRREVSRLSSQYRAAGDDQLAFPTDPPDDAEPTSSDAQ